MMMIIFSKKVPQSQKVHTKIIYISNNNAKAIKVIITYINILTNRS